jgi:uncharacterized protein
VSVLLRNLLHFGRLLGSLGLDVHGGRMIDVARALEHVDIGRRSDFYFTLRSLLVHRHQDLAVFDQAFHLFWRPLPGESSSGNPRAIGEQRRFGSPQKDVQGIEPRTSDDPSLPARTETIEHTAPMSYSSRETMRRKDFAHFSEQEIERVKTIIAAFNWDLGRRQTRRWAPGRGGVPDLRRVIRTNLRYGGEPLLVPTRHRPWKRRPLVLLCDVSGSMERYARMLLHFIHSLTRGLDRVESFLFATHLTRITREIARRGIDEVVPGIPQSVPDWGGGTRIGEALRAFNVRWARRVLGYGPVVLLVSDGWDRGDPDLLQREMSRLQRSCYRLIWLNPLIGSPEYRPLTRGMQAALLHVDDFLPVHNLVSLEALAVHLNRLPERRGARTPHRVRFGDRQASKS